MPIVSVPASMAKLMAPLEQHANEKLARLRATGAFLRDLQCVQDKYALECSKLPFAIPDTLRRRLVRDDSHKTQPLGRVASGLEAFVRKHNDAKMLVAKELARGVVVPMEAFLDQQGKQTKCLLTEIAQALQSEQELHAQCLSLRSTGSATANQADAKQHGSNQNEDMVTDKIQKHNGVKILLKRHEQERLVVRDRLDELHLIEQQQLAVTNTILERVVEAFYQLIAQTTSLIADLQATLAVQAQQQQHSSDKHDPEGCDSDDEQSWKAFLKQCERHVVITEWLNGFFAQLFVVEENMIKRLQAMLKLHPNSDVFTTAVDIGSAGPGAFLANRDGASVPVISDLMHFHKLLTVNLMDPIGRTLKFSKHKQNKIRQELLTSLDETAKLVQRTRKQVKERELKHLKLLHSSVSSAAVAPSGAHAGDPATASVTASFSGHIADAMRLNLSNFGLRSAVVTMSKTTGTLGKPRTSLSDVDGGDEPSSDVALMAKRQPPTPLTGAEKELNDARVYLLSLQRNEVEQRREIIKTLRSTSLLGVKTMELMVHDYLKHVGNALRTLKVCIDGYDAMRAAGAQASGSTGNLGSSGTGASKWHSFIQFPSQDDADLKKGLDGEDDEDGPEQDAECGASNQVDEGSGRLERGTEQQQQRRRAAKLTWLRDVNLNQVPRSKSGMTSSVKSQSSSNSQLSAATSSQLGSTLRDLARMTAAKVQSVLSVSLERIFAHVFRSELSTLLALNVALMSVALAALVVWLHLAYLQQSWEEIAELQRSNAKHFENMRQVLTKSNRSITTTCVDEAQSHLALASRRPALDALPERQAAAQHDAVATSLPASEERTVRKRSDRGFAVGAEPSHRRPRRDRLHPFSTIALQASQPKHGTQSGGLLTRSWWSAKLKVALESLLQYMLVSVVSCITCAALVWLVRRVQSQAIGVRIDFGSFSVDV